MSRYIPVITKEYSRKISVDDIIYLEQRQRKLAIVTDDETYVCYERIENIEKQLDDKFYHAEEVSSQFGKSFGDERSESHISERQHTYVGQRKLYKDETDIHSLSERSAEMNG